MLPPGIFGIARPVGPGAQAPCEPLPAAMAVVAGNFLSTSSPVARSATVVRSAAPKHPLLATCPGESSPREVSMSSERISPLSCSPEQASMQSELISAFSSSPRKASERPELPLALGMGECPAQSMLQFRDSPHGDGSQGRALPYTPGETLAKSALFSGGKDGELRPLKGLALPSECSPSSSQAETEAGSPCWSDADLDSASPVVSLTPQNPSVVIKLEGLVGPPPVLPTVGSAGHIIGACKPCAFIFKGGCQSGTSCQFCHLCSPGEKQRRRKERKVTRNNLWVITP